MGNFHKMGCKGKELEAQRQQNREFAKTKQFDSVLAANRAQAQALRIGFKQAAKAKKMPFCKNFNAKAVPCQGECIAYPCNNWEEIVETELSFLKKGDVLSMVQLLLLHQLLVFGIEFLHHRVALRECVGSAKLCGVLNRKVCGVS